MKQAVYLHTRERPTRCTLFFIIYFTWIILDNKYFKNRFEN